MSMNKAQAGKKVAKKPVAKKKTPHPNDDYKDMVDPATGKKGTMGGEGTTPPFTAEERRKMPKVGSMGSGKNGKTMSKAKNGKSFPDLNKDGKVTRADILKGRGVIAKKGATIKKAQTGSAVKPYEKSVKTSKQVGVRGNDLFRVDGAGKFIEKATNPQQKIALRSKQTKDSTRTMNSRNRMAESARRVGRTMKTGGSMKTKGPKKAALGALLPLAMKALPMVAGMLGGKKKKNGGSMKKCKYGCK